MVVTQAYGINQGILKGKLRAKNWRAFVSYNTKNTFQQRRNFPIYGHFFGCCFICLTIFHKYNRFDYVTITDDEGTEIGRFCGRQTGKIIFLTGEFFAITFHSDHSREERGFHLKFTAVPFGTHRGFFITNKVKFHQNDFISAI